MKVLQVADGHGSVRLAFLEGTRVSVLKSPHGGIATALDFLVAVGERGLDAAAWRAEAAFDETTWDALRSGGRLALPVTPAEVWGAGVTYKRSADFREEGTGIYDRVYAAPRPELFFKATAARCVGARPGDRPPPRLDLHRVRARARDRARRLGDDPRLHARERRVRVGHRARQPAVPAAVEGVRGVLRVRSGGGHGGRHRRPLCADAASAPSTAAAARCSPGPPAPPS